MTTSWDPPSESVKFPTSDNPTVNFCEGIIQKVKMLNENFRGNRLPEY
jgi:hypothetical protein